MVPFLSEAVDLVEASLCYFFENWLMKLKFFYLRNTTQILSKQNRTCRNRIQGSQGGHWPPKYLADQLTLFQPGEGRLSHLLLLPPPKKKNHLHHVFNENTDKLIRIHILWIALMKILLDASFLHNKEEKYYYKYRLQVVCNVLAHQQTLQT